jgi:hypothetical protein
LLRFDSPSEVRLELTLGGVGSGVYDLPVGMDGVPRFSESWPTGIPVGILGEWSEPSVFSVHIDEVAGTKHLRIRGEAISAEAPRVWIWSSPTRTSPSLARRSKARQSLAATEVFDFICE